MYIVIGLLVCALIVVCILTFCTGDCPADIDIISNQKDLLHSRLNKK